MRDLGTLWERCNNGDIQKGEWDYQRRLTIDGVVYHDEDIIKVTHDKGLVANSFSVGNTISGSIKATVIPHTDHTVRRNGKILLELRIATLYDGATDWFEFGHYYINSAKREKDKWTIDGYDAINQLETPFVTSNTNWPQSCTNAINQILSFLSIDLDPRTSINSSLQIQDPTEFTMREVLGYIGGLHGGNWYITETNKLRLVIPSLGTKVATVLPGNTKKLVDSGVMNFDKVILKFSSSVKDKYTSGSGRNELEVYNPWGTQSTADSIRSILSNYDYYPGEYKSTEINPAIELGDTIEIDGKLVNLWQVNYSTRIYADIYIPDQTDKYRDTYDFTVGGGYEDYDYDHLQDRVSLLESMFGIDGCKLLELSDTDYPNYPSRYTNEDYRCVILPTRSLTSPDQDFDGAIDLFDSTYVNKVISQGSALSTTNGMFANSKSDTLDISRLDTRSVGVMSNMFKNISMTNLNLNDLLTHNVRDMSYMFTMSRIGTLNIENIDTSAVVNMRGMFRNMRTDFVNFSNFDTSAVANMQDMFSGVAFNTLDLSSFNTSNVEDMGGMFSRTAFNTLDLSSFDTSNVENMGDMFSSASFNTLDLSSFNFNNVEFISSFFNRLTLKDLKITQLNLNNIKSMSNMFRGSKIDNLDTSLILSESNEEVHLDYLFYNTKYEKIDLSGLNINVKSLRQAFTANDTVSLIDISGLNLSNANVSKSIPKRQSGISYATGLPFSDIPLTVLCRSESDKALLVNQYFKDNWFDPSLQAVSEVTFAVKS